MPVEPFYVSPQRAEEHELVQQFWQKMHQRDGEFQREQEELKQMERQPAFETWEMLKQRRIRAGHEKRKRNKEMARAKEAEQAKQSRRDDGDEVMNESMFLDSEVD